MFMVYGPMGPFTNQPPAHEAQVNWMADVVKYVRENDLEFLDPSDETESNWMVTCDDIAYQTLFMKVNSWINGSNVPGKPVTNYFYMGGMGAYMDIILDIRDRGFPGFEPGKRLTPA
jgi:cyclohexanone monooxygenase